MIGLYSIGMNNENTNAANLEKMTDLELVSMARCFCIDMSQMNRTMIRNAIATACDMIDSGIPIKMNFVTLENVN